MAPRRKSRMSRSGRPLVILLAAAGLVWGRAAPAMGQSPPAGEAVMAWHVRLAPSWFDPSTAPPQITPFGMLYAIHDSRSSSSRSTG